MSSRASSVLLSVLLGLGCTATVADPQAPAPPVNPWGVGTDPGAASGDAGTDAGLPSVPAEGEDAGTPCTPASATVAPDRIEDICRTSTFDETFATYDISSGPVADGQHEGERWFNGTEQCCLSTTNGWPAVNFPTPSIATKQPVNPYALLPAGGLRIRASQADSEWFSGVMTSVDKNGEGFSQMYGYFEINAKLPPGTGTWPSFWMLSLPMGAPGGEIDVFEQYGCNPPLNPENERRFHFTIHDWTGKEKSYEYFTPVLDDLTADFHRYGVLWREGYLALYFDGRLLSTGPVPSVMKNRKYYLLVDMGIGSGWDTVQTPNPSDLEVKSVRAWQLP